MAKVMEHEADGIQEYDNPPPGWLMLVLYGTVIFGIGYAIYYPSFWFWPGLSGWTSSGQYQAQMEEAEKAYGHLKKEVAEVTLQLNDPAALALGQKQYKARCAPCHGDAGEGRVGPSLVDDVWLYGDTDTDLVVSIRDGRPKGMPPWGKVLKPDEVLAVASFVRTLPSAGSPGTGSSPQPAGSPQP